MTAQSTVDTAIVSPLVRSKDVAFGLVTSVGETWNSVAAPRSPHSALDCALQRRDGKGFDRHRRASEQRRRQRGPEGKDNVSVDSGTRWRDSSEECRACRAGELRELHSA
jgi:hypothetical protein